MAYIFQAEVWCDDCGKHIAERLKADGQEVPEDPEDHDSFDSDDFPKGPFPDDDPADTPTHCASDDECINAVHLSFGRKVGAIVSGLTEDGRKYALEKIRLKPNDALMDLWVSHYDLNPEEADDVD